MPPPPPPASLNRVKSSLYNVDAHYGVRVPKTNVYGKGPKLKLSSDELE